MRGALYAALATAVLWFGVNAAWRVGETHPCFVTGFKLGFGVNDNGCR